MQSNPVKIVAMASGRGSNFTAVVEAIASGKIRNSHMAALITDRASTGAEEFALTRGIPVFPIECDSFSSRDDFDAAVEAKLQELAPDLIVTLGYMRIIPPETIRRYSGKIINIHPSLLPAFPGISAQKKAWKYGVKVAGCTVHFTDEGVDTGPIIQQAAIPVPPGIDAAGLAALILKEEHRILVESVDLFCSGRVKIAGRKVEIQ